MATRSEDRSRSRSPVKNKVRNKRILVSNIPFNLALKELRDLFKEKIGICGQVEYIDNRGKFTGNATMEFKTLDGAQKAVDAMHKHPINGREIIVREETPKDRDRLGLNKRMPEIPDMGRPNSSLMQLVNELEREGPITNSLFMANLHYSLTWQKLKDMFKEAGRVRHVDLKVDSDGTSRGFGTVEFESPEEAILAIHMFNNKIINNREIKLRMDKSGKHLVGRLDVSKFGDYNSRSPDLNPQIRRVLEELMSAIANPGRSNPQAMKALNELVVLSQLFDRSSGSPFDVQSSFKSFDRNPPISSGGLSKLWNENSSSGFLPDYLASQAFDNGGYKSSFSKLSMPEMNRSRDMGRYSPPQANPNIGQNDMVLLEELLMKMKNSDQHSLVSVLSSVLAKKGSESNSAPIQLGGSRFNEFSTAQSNTLLVKNIPFSFTWKDLKHSFSQAPGILSTEIIRDEFNRSKGIGLVMFQSSSDAQRCKNIMDGTLLDGRPIQIDFSHSLK